jgi:hypothetical protein
VDDRHRRGGTVGHGRRRGTVGDHENLRVEAGAGLREPLDEAVAVEVGAPVGYDDTEARAARCAGRRELRPGRNSSVADHVILRENECRAGSTASINKSMSGNTMRRARFSGSANRMV